MCGAILQNTAPSKDAAAYNYLAFKSHRAAASHILSLPELQRTFCENICEFQAHFVFFDVDVPLQKWEQIAMKGAQGTELAIPDFQFDRDCDRFLAHIACWIITFVKRHYDVSISMDGLRVMTANTKDKISYHIVLGDLFFRNANARAQFGQSISKSTQGKEIIGFPGTIDASVYNKGHRTFRGLYCNKYDNSKRDYTFRRRHAKENWFTPVDGVPGCQFATWDGNKEKQILQSMLTYNVHQRGRPLPPAGVATYTDEKVVNVANREVKEEFIKRVHSHVLGTLPTLRHWVNGNTVYCMTPKGGRRCPHGVLHKSNNFHMKIINRELYYDCASFQQSGAQNTCTPRLTNLSNGRLLASESSVVHSEGGAPGEADPFGADNSSSKLPAMYGVEREMYYHTINIDGKPKDCIRPLSATFNEVCEEADGHESNGKSGTIVECSFCGLGKTHALCDLVAEDHSGGESQKILIIVHRVKLAQKVAEDLNRRIVTAPDRVGLAVDLYSDTGRFPEGSPITSTRLVVCVNSLWRVSEQDWDLIAIDEVPEVIKAVCTLQHKSRASNRWAIWEILVELVSAAKRVYLMSAQVGVKPANEDSAVELLCQARRTDAFGKAKDCKWQMNAANPLKDIKYKFIFTDHNEIALEQIKDRLHAGRT